jgi:hypothetical protein
VYVQFVILCVRVCQQINWKTRKQFSCRAVLKQHLGLQISSLRISLKNSPTRLERCRVKATTPCSPLD